MDGLNTTSNVRYLHDSVLTAAPFGGKVAAEEHEKAVQAISNNLDMIGLVGPSWVDGKYDATQIEKRMGIGGMC